MTHKILFYNANEPNFDDIYSTISSQLPSNSDSNSGMWGNGSLFTENIIINQKNCNFHHLREVHLKRLLVKLEHT